MFDSKETKYPLKTTGVLTLLNLQFYITQMDLPNLEQLILVLNSLKREADALSNDGKGGSDDCMTIYNGALELINVVSKDKEKK